MAGDHRPHRPTDPTAIEFRHGEDILSAAADPEAMYRDVVLPRKLDLYERYIAERSFVGDLGILLRTLWVVVKG
jgi:lipopolysaccharide/colanic/teichoic acid biosynthesis glycosyltransferase